MSAMRRYKDIAADVERLMGGAMKMPKGTVGVKVHDAQGLVSFFAMAFKRDGHRPVLFSVNVKRSMFHDHSKDELVDMVFKEMVGKMIDDLTEDAIGHVGPEAQN